MGGKNLPKVEKFKYRRRTWAVTHSTAAEAGCLVLKCMY
jgi:hypothetical protein